MNFVHINIEPNSCGTKNLSTREQWLAESLSLIPKGSRILDAGAGELKYASLCTHLDYVSQDFAQYDGTGDDIGLQPGSWDTSRIDIVSDIEHIPEPDESFDAIMCVEVLEHLPNPVNAIRELARLLKPGGNLVLTAPFCCLTHMAPYFYHSGFSRYFYEHWLINFGFEIEDMQWNGNFFEYLAQELRRMPSIGKEYSGYTIDTQEQNALNVLLDLLNRLSMDDDGSNQLLSLGLHIRGRKIISTTAGADRKS